MLNVLTKQTKQKIRTTINMPNLISPTSVATPLQEELVAKEDDLKVSQEKSLQEEPRSSPQSFRTVEQLDHHHDQRVFRSLSNTTAKATAQSPSDLKHIFLPPISSSTTSLQQRGSPSSQQQRKQQQKRLSIFFGCRLDHSTMMRVPLRRTGKSKAARRPATPEEEAQEAKQLAATDHSPRQKLIKFARSVAVVRIPSHKDYSKSLKASLWNSLKEIKASAVRNTTEYIYERCQWRKAIEEPDMYRDTRSGAYVHPVHVQRYYAKQEEQAKKKKKEKQEKRSSFEPEACDENDQKKPAAKESCSSRKRARCSTPSPIRRLQEVSMATASTGEQHAPKRQRTILSPVPSRRPPSHYQYQQQQAAQAAQHQASSDAYYGQQFQQQQQASYWQPRTFSPVSSNHTFTFPAQA